MKDIIISPCTKGDLPDLINIAITSYNEHYTYLWHDGGMQYVKQHFNYHTILREWTDPKSAFFMLYYQGNLVGFLKLINDKVLKGYNQEECLELERVYIIRAVSGSGIGAEAVRFTLDYARQQGKRIVWLKAMDSSPEVIQFYERSGFRKCATFVQDTPEMKEEFRGMHVMKHVLSEAGVSEYTVTASANQEEVSLA
ncbi:GNAT family N-acetyltransferase [Pontibacter beigongshangensis]|uniref:GNAT family N-acetyltransferase n=1 Tax=Pontibacter beigongshangensis TaxID=2574733 RepID=UPI00164FFBC1|nr:GNAT family N-acetyltransferase [Pontibacter beigongshangensis]